MLVLARLGYFHIAEMRQLLERAGSAKTLFDNRNNIRDILPECNAAIVSSFLQSGDAEKRAEAEMQFMERHHIKCMTLGDADYPQRLMQCDDAPLVLFHLGNADFNKQHIVSIVGTRKCTPYGHDVTERFVRELKEICPDVMIVSGLAYGIDIVAHRAALANGLDTVGIVAHGLDYLYPATHRNTAKEMIGHGGLLTEFFKQTKAEPANFLRRNRIVAGLADATLVVESAYRGGSLSTARIANDYNRDVFAVPGNIGEAASEGCNKLIAKHKAQLFTSAEDFAETMGWMGDAIMGGAQKNNRKGKGAEPNLFSHEFNPQEQKIVDTLRANNNIQINILSVQAGISIPELSSLLFDLEMAGVIKALPGGVYHLI